MVGFCFCIISSTLARKTNNPIKKDKVIIHTLSLFYLF